ncbi:uncharacterized protein [Lolium perenne]|uniref:uncharacterized protein n=1 Tax=Lolium perenne TaxID=4522 RepID=UPI0021F5A8EF|nr:uncharacterized protein LOC127324037 [Lolium perenne]
MSEDYAASRIDNKHIKGKLAKNNGSTDLATSTSRAVCTSWDSDLDIVDIIGPNADTVRQLLYVLDAPLGDLPTETALDEVKNVYLTRKNQYSIVQCAILYGLESELQKYFENHDPFDIIHELKMIFEFHVDGERYEVLEQFFGCKMEEGSSVSENVLKMYGHVKKLQDLGITIPNALGIHRVLQSVPPSYKNFVINYNIFIFCNMRIVLTVRQLLYVLDAP